VHAQVDQASAFAEFELAGVKVLLVAAFGVFDATADARGQGLR
jgi:hypothetical protein